MRPVLIDQRPRMNFIENAYCYLEAVPGCQESGQLNWIYTMMRYAPRRLVCLLGRGPSLLSCQRTHLRLTTTQSSKVLPWLVDTRYALVLRHEVLRKRCSSRGHSAIGKPALRRPPRRPRTMYTYEKYTF
jgi:hypothetical protein